MVATAIHAGHELRPSIAALTALDDATRLREEDPFTDRLAEVGGTTVVVHRSRFEVDLNRPREASVYRVPDDAWGLDLWRAPLPEEDVARSRRLYDDFYAELARRLDVLAARGPFLVLDVHSYNHRRDGVDASPAPVGANPEVNVGTGSLDRHAGAVSSTGSWTTWVVVRSAATTSTCGRTSASEGVSSVAGSTGATTPGAARWRSSSRSCSWTSGPARSTSTISTSFGDALAAVVPTMTDELRCPVVGVTATPLAGSDLAVDRALADIATSFRFLLDVTPVDLVRARKEFWDTGRPPAFEYRPLERRSGRDECPPRRRAGQRGRGSDGGAPAAGQAPRAAPAGPDAVVPGLGRVPDPEHRAVRRRQSRPAPRGRGHPATVPRATLDRGPQLDADAFVRLAQTELDRYRAFAPDIESHVELREGSTGVMVSNGDLLVAPTARVSAARADALLHHEIGTHVVTFVNGSHQQLRTLASGLAGHDETQEGLAVLAEYLVGGLTAGRLRQLAARVVAVHQMISGAGVPRGTRSGWSMRASRPCRRSPSPCVCSARVD